MKRLTAAATVLSVVTCAAPAPADDHLVSLQLAQARLAEASQRRSDDVATLRLILSNPTVGQATVASPVDPEALVAKLSTLGGRELHEFADRAARLDADPVAGMSGWVKGPPATTATRGRGR